MVTPIQRLKALVLPGIREARLLFDPVFYRSKNPGVEGSDYEIFLHYLSVGWKQERDPSPNFSSAQYLLAYPDVRELGMEPLRHYCLYGRAEGRQTFMSSAVVAEKVREDSDESAIAPYFDAEFYVTLYPDVLMADMSPRSHYLKIGWREARDPSRDFSTAAYLDHNPDAARSGMCPLLHYALIGQREHRKIEPSAAELVEPELLDAVCEHFDESFYRLQTDKLGDIKNALEHYLVRGWRQGFDPNPNFSSSIYLQSNPDVRLALINPLLHWVKAGQEEGREAAPSRWSQNKLAQTPKTTGDAIAQPASPSTDDIIGEYFDPEYYLASNPDVRDAGIDALEHYRFNGWREGRQPTPDFSPTYYLETNPDVKAADLEPFEHYLRVGKDEGRRAMPRADHDDLIKADAADDVFAATQYFSGRGEDFELSAPADVDLLGRRAKLLAFYLPQFHTIPENDEWWGKGFTEWTNVGRGMPRFKGHAQPRIPRDLGHYDLERVDALRQQVEMAKTHGVFGFAIYYYFFNGKRLLDKPIENLLKNPDIDMPFCLVWANENWTRTWDGFQKNVLVSQDYLEEDEDKLLADWGRHIKDPRYIRFQDRPFLVIYRPALIPDAKATIARWRERMKSEYDEDPIFFMAQGFDDYDPEPYGLDGAMEFPPHKILSGQPTINQSLDLFDPSFQGNVFDYEAAVDRAGALPPHAANEIKSVTLAWDNEARRPGRGMTLTNFSPRAYQRWLDQAITYAEANPVFGEAVVGINAWNEWAEGTYLEPDTHYGFALLNATSRAVACQSPKARILLVGHDAHKHGAQALIRNIGLSMTAGLGLEVRYLILGEGDLIEAYQQIGQTIVADRNKPETIEDAVANAAADGFELALTNTTVSGTAVAALKAHNFRITSLIHELPRLITEFGLEPAAKSIAQNSDTVIFPGPRVQSGFISKAGEINGDNRIRPQGLYKPEILTRTRHKSVRKQLGLPEGTKIVINSGYADWRKGFDLFVQTADMVCRQRDDVAFVWVGNVNGDIEQWLMNDFANGRLKDRFFVTDFVEDVKPYYWDADLFLLTSREDPFPSVVMEAMAAELQLVCFEGHGDTEALVAKHGKVVGFADIHAASEAVLELLGLPEEDAKASGETAKQAVIEDHNFDDYVFDLVKSLKTDTRSVSVVIPNYNYEHHLEQRLRSIFEQTYPIREIIFLDDKSPDQSVKLARELAARFGRRMDIVVNRRNSGSVFKQWRKGADLAKSEFVWIAEADDDASPDFLEKLMAMYSAEKELNFAFADSWQMDNDGAALGDSYRTYIGAYSSGAFDKDFIVPASDFLHDHLSIRNVILNVSSAVWRTDSLRKAIKSVGNELFDFTVAGDWRLYVALCQQGGKLGYCADALNGHRRHASSVTHALKAETHAAEIIKMQRMCNDAIGTTEEKLASKQRQALEEACGHLGVRLEAADA